MSKRLIPGSLIMAAAVVLLVACGKKEEVSSKKAQTVAAPAAAQDPKPGVDVGLTTFFRAHPRSDKVCYDSNYDAYLVHYKDIALDEEVPTDRFFGWYFVQNVKFYQLANNTWFTGSQPDSAYFRAYPNVTGLPCKEIRDGQ